MKREFQSKFLQNSTLPCDFQEDGDYVSGCAATCNKNLIYFECVGGDVRRLTLVPESEWLYDLDFISSNASYRKRIDSYEVATSY